MFNCKNIPEFSQRNYNIVGYIVAFAITCAAIYLIYQLLFNSDISFSANWNMFKSILMWPLYIIGLIVMFANWDLFSFSYDSYEKVTYGNGRVEVRRNWDLIEWMMGHILVPIIGRFFLVPIMVAALIYYPLMCIVHLVGAVFPYILSLIVIGITIVAWKFTSWFNFQYHSAVLVFAGLFFSIAFSWTGYYISHVENITNVTIIQNGDGKGGGETPSQPEPTPPGNPQGDNNKKDENKDDDKGDNKDSKDKGDNGTGDDNNGGDDDFDDDFEEPDGGTGNKSNRGSDTKVVDTTTPCDGLYKALPDGTTEYEGDISGTPIIFTITKLPTGELKGVFEEKSSGIKMELRGESLPDCDIKFKGKADDDEWTFRLSGKPDDIFGSVQINQDKKKRGLTLYKKGLFDDDNFF